MTEAQSPVDPAHGTRPSHAAKSRPLENVRPPPIAATRAVALITPMPGIVISRLAPLSSRARATNSASNASIRVSRVAPLQLHILDQHSRASAE
jgi:hypothetical protein